MLMAAELFKKIVFFFFKLHGKKIFTKIARKIYIVLEREQTVL